MFDRWLKCDTLEEMRVENGSQLKKPDSSPFTASSLPCDGLSGSASFFNCATNNPCRGALFELPRTSPLWAVFPHAPGQPANNTCPRSCWFWARTGLPTHFPERPASYPSIKITNFRIPRRSPHYCNRGWFFHLSLVFGITCSCATLTQADEAPKPSSISTVIPRPRIINDLASGTADPGEINVPDTRQSCFCVVLQVHDSCVE